MKVSKIENMKGGWFIGNFEPSLFKTDQVEVAIQRFPAGEHKPSHHHKVATEFTVIVSGEARMNGKRYCAGDIIEIEPGESTDFYAVEETVTAVVKIPCVAGDKYADE